jgi:hypothetical protein
VLLEAPLVLVGLDSIRAAAEAVVVAVITLKQAQQAAVVVDLREQVLMVVLQLEDQVMVLLD